MSKTKIDLSNKLILCFYEGNAEKEILDMLIDNDKLIFKKQDLMFNDFQKRISVKKVGPKYFKYDFEKDVVIIRVIDSKKEEFILKRPYSSMCKEIYTCRTCPEIEFLLIIYHHDEIKFQQEKLQEHLKAGQFCKKHYKYSKTKDIKYFTNNLTVEELITLLKKYDSNHPNEYTICSLLE
jgi:hypothetical protein